MNIRRFLLAAFALILIAAPSFAQKMYQPRVITTAVPFASINPDSRGGAMGDCGVASSADVYSMHYNPAKYTYLQDKWNIGVGYSPWLHALVKDMGLFYVAGAYKINDRSSVAATMRYFRVGEVDFRDEQNNPIRVVNPNEWAIDATYSRMLGDYLSGAVAARFIRSDLTQGVGDYTRAGISVAADIAVYYKRPVEWFNSVDADFSWGAGITNIGSKMTYNSSSDKKDFIPTTLRLGACLDLGLNEYNTLAFNVDFSKLMVPTPPVRDQQTGEVLYGYDDNVAVVMGMIQSFYDAPGWAYNTQTSQFDHIGTFYEELCEVNFGVGIEYWYNKLFSVRAGYFNESALKGNRKYITAGAGLRYNVFGLDVSYLIPVGSVVGSNPLENTLRFNLSFAFGGKKKS
jgi:hypothetical protein